jgi:hypothetical protein
VEKGGRVADIDVADRKSISANLTLFVSLAAVGWLITSTGSLIAALWDVASRSAIAWQSCLNIRTAEARTMAWKIHLRVGGREVFQKVPLAHGASAFPPAGEEGDAIG